MEIDGSEPIHAPGVLEETLPPEKCLGPVDPATVVKVEDEEENPKDIQGIPPIHRVINIDDFEVYSPPGVWLTIENIAKKCQRYSLGILFFCRR